MSEPVAGPSRPTSPHFFPRPFRIDDYQPPPPSTSSRSSTPILIPPVRARSTSAFSYKQEKKHNARLDKKRFESVQRLQSAWERLLLKYGDIGIEDDDEIDLVTGRVVKNRGRLKSLVAREFGEVSDGEGNEDEVEEVDSVDEDDDELGFWDERSGLDTQHPEDEPPPAKPPWTYEDDEDLRAFLRAEKERRRTAVDRGEESEDEDEQRQSSLGDLRSADEEDSSSSSEEISPRSRGTTIVNDLSSLFGDEEFLIGEGSEDELLAQTSDAEEATRVELVDNASDEDEDILPPARRLPTTALGYTNDEDTSLLASKGQLEVVIPIRTPKSSRSSRNRQSPQLQLTRIHSSPDLANLFDTPPPDVDPDTSADTDPIILSTLRDLFTPPRDVWPIVAVPQFSTSANMYGALPFTTSIFSTSHRSPGAPKKRGRKSLQHKDQMVGEKHAEPELPDGATCEACTMAGGFRAERARLCRGVTETICPFERNDMIDPSLDDEQADQPEAGPSRLGPRYTTPAMTIHISESEDRDTPPPRNSSRAPRTCKACRQAGGIRRVRAIECKGRRSSDLCPFDEYGYRKPIPVDVDDEDDHRPLKLPVPSNEAPPTEESWRYYKALTYPTPAAKTPRSCKHCRAAGGIRARNAIWCIGRVWGKRCSWIVEEQEALAGSPIAMAQEGGLAEGQVHDDNRGDGPRTPAREEGYREDSPVSVRPASSGKRKRILSDEPENVSNDSINSWETALNQSAGSLPPSSPPQYQDHETPEAEETVEYEVFQSVVDQDEAGDVVAEVVMQNLDDGHLPAVPVDSAAEVDEGSRSNATPSPPSCSLSTTIRMEDNYTSRLSPSLPPDADLVELLHRPDSLSNPPSSPFARPIISLRANTIAFRPTPPPSSAGARSPSLSSDHPLSVPRKGILRRPSEPGSGSGSVPRSSKRTRFSLVPRSPPRDISSDPILPFELAGIDMDVDSDDDELLLGPASSPFTMTRHSTSSPTVRNVTSAFSREISLRAQDIGYNLPEHTGKLSSRMLAELGPALAVNRPGSPTLGSSLNPSRAEKLVGQNPIGYALPTPPPSFGSTTSSSSSTRRTPLPTSPGTAALMLPPPVPARRSSVRPPTPTSGEGEQDDDDDDEDEDEDEEEEEKEEKEEEVIVFKTVTPLHIRHRSKSISRPAPASRMRSRSVSVAPKQRWKANDNKDSSSPGPMAQRQPSTTPRKRSRLERSLARIAREMEVEQGELEWGMDEDVGGDLGRLWREASVVRYLD